MASQKVRVFKVPEAELIKAFEKIAIDCDATAISLTLQLGERHKNPLKGELDELKDNDSFRKILKSKYAIFDRVNCSFTGAGSLNIQREDQSDLATISFGDQENADKVAQFIMAVHKHIRVYERTESIDKVLGDELAEFYNRREEGLLRLEELSQQLIERNNEYTQKLDEEYEQIRSELKLKHDEALNKLEEKYSEKEEQLKQREQDLEKIKQEIDDKDSKYARRQIRKDLKKALENRSKEFTLTDKTNQKRKPIHGLFIFLIIITGFLVAQTILTSDSLLTEFQIWPTTKLAISTFALIASVIFYIRWNDNWFRQHADEEFNLKRLELDIDRASWVVEMALEWQAEKGTEIPSHLLERLTDNLFLKQSNSNSPKHPTEDLSSAIIAASSGLTLNVPGVGEIALDRKGIRKLKKELKNRNEG